ncbi:MAG TPA: glycosyltransferase [Solirubrobacteraceae bacterium]|nr:glycosyltransferase [Solirubrobacteraceae bacterium]
MSRPAVSVVMPFAGDAAAAARAIASLRSLTTTDGDELILSDNSGGAGVFNGIAVVDATGERSPSHARNAGAARASCDWILFLDADCIPDRGLIDAYFAVPVGERVGALAGEVLPVVDTAGTVAERYAAARNFLGQRAHLAHPYRPRAVAANLLVRRAAFEQLGGFAEGVRAGEDTDFSWRLQEAGWLLEPRAARVQHRYRATVSELRRQWRGYAAGRAWLATRYPEFKPEPALAHALHGRGRRSAGASATSPAPRPIRDRLLFLALDAVLAVDELIGLRMSNRARRC